MTYVFLQVLSLYQTLLVSMRALPLSLATLEALSTAVHAGLVGRMDKRESAKEAFSEYWQATYADKPDFAELLPEKIAICLDIMNNLSEASSLIRLLDDGCSEISASEVEEQLLPESEDEDEVSEPSTPKARALELPPGHLLQTSSSALVGSSGNPIEIPSTPKSSPRSSPPHRPHKTPQIFDLTSDSPPSSPLRAAGSSSGPVTPTKKSPEQRRLTASGRSLPNKENVSPLPRFASIAERIASMSPGSTSTLGKRRAPDGEEDADVTKRHKKSSSLPSIFEDEGASMEMLQDGNIPSTPRRALPPRIRKVAMVTTPAHARTMPSMKLRTRKSILPNAAGSPPNLRKRSSDESMRSGDSSEQERPTIPLRRTRSATRASGKPLAIASDPAGTSRKRRRDFADSTAHTPSKRSVASGSSSPSGSVIEPIFANSGMYPQFSKRIRKTYTDSLSLFQTTLSCSPLRAENARLRGTCPQMMTLTLAKSLPTAWSLPPCVASRAQARTRPAMTPSWLPVPPATTSLAAALPVRQ